MSTATRPDSRSAILDAAEQVMAKVGYHEASISVICAESGLPVGSLYHHFGSKAGLLAAVLDRGQRRFFAMMPYGPDRPGSAAEHMAAHWLAAADAIAANVSYFVLEGRLGEVDAPIADVVAATQQRVEQRLFEVIEPAAREAGAAHPAELARELAAVTRVFTRGVIADTGADAGRMREHMAALLRLLRARIDAG